MSRIEEVSDTILGHAADNAAEALDQAGHLMPDLPPPTSKTDGVWETGDIDITAEGNGAVTIEYADDYDGDIWGSQTTRSVGLTRAQVLAILAASEWNPDDRH